MKTVPGIEVFTENLTKNNRIRNSALLTNPTGIDSSLNSSVDLLKNSINLTTLLSPEHGIRGNFQAGENVPDHFENRFKLPVFSLYDQSGSNILNKNINPDEKMRKFDTSTSGKIIKHEILKNIEQVIIDIQDIGTRIYTYISTMAYLMSSCRDNGIKLIVTDRPNPITGMVMEGPVLEFPGFSSFVGVYALPVRHGMTLGEIALFLNRNLFQLQVDLSVIPMKNWKRDMWFDETSLIWINPSPNMPTITTANVYPGMVFFEGTNLSEGRGTTKPFEMIGSPWLDGYKLSQMLNSIDLNGVIFKETFFKPSFSKYSGQMCSGVCLIITNREKFEPYLTMLSIMSEIIKNFSDDFKFHTDYFDKMTGNSWVRTMLLKGNSPLEIREKYMKELNDFQNTREEFLLYLS